MTRTCISAVIFVLLIGTVRGVGRRLLDGVEPELVDHVEHAIEHLHGVTGIHRIRLRWVGHRLHGDAILDVDARHPDAAVDAERSVRAHLPNVDDFLVSVRASNR